MAEKRHALLITSSRYEDPKLAELAAPNNDAKLLASVLKSQVGGFSVTRLTNPTHWRAAKAVEEFFNDRNYDEVLLLYFSGHGLKTDGGELFFAMRNTRRQTLRTTSLPSQTVRDIMKASGSDRQLLILDCCYGGAFARGFKSDDGVDASERLQGYGTVVLTASNSLEFAWEGSSDDRGQTSAYTRALVAGLQDLSADLDGDGRVTVDELHKFASKHLRQLRVPQTPTISTVGQEGELVIARGRPRRKAVAGVSLDLSQYCTIRDSGPEGSVVGQALAGAMDASLAYQGREERLSARYIYAKARVLGFGEDQWQADHGAFTRDGLTTVTDFGVPLEAAWPYVPQAPALPDGKSWEDMDAALPRFKARVHPITSYEQIPFHLLQGRPIVTGLTVYSDSWWSEKAATEGLIEVSKSGSPSGGHAIAIVGYDPARDALKCANSWGTGWGIEGFFYISRAATEQALLGDKNEPEFWAIEVPLTPEYCIDAPG